MLALVVPAFGVIYRITTVATTQQVYCEFLKDAFEVVRALITDNQRELCLIHDNAKYHNNIVVKELIEDLKVNELPTIQYSPQLNEVAECLFGCSKAKVKPAQFPHTVMKRKVTKTAITNWINAVAQFDAQVSMKYYAVWRNIVKSCLSGKPLGSDHVHVFNCYYRHLRDICTLRKKNQDN